MRHFEVNSHNIYQKEKKIEEDFCTDGLIDYNVWSRNVAEESEHEDYDYDLSIFLILLLLFRGTWLESTVQRLSLQQLP
jgi:hypothetical protein